MSLKTLQDKFLALSGEIKGLMVKGDRSDVENQRIDTALEEGTALQVEIERELKRTNDAARLAEWSNKSAGMLTLANPVVGMSPAGGAEVTYSTDNSGHKSIFAADDGEMLLDGRNLKALRSSEYGQAFKSYLRVGKGGLKDSALKVLQEGVDTSGGFGVPEEVLNRIVAKEPGPTHLAGRVTTLTTSRDVLTMPRIVYATDNIYTSGMRVTWTGEIPAAATTHRVTEPSFGSVRIPVFTAMMSLPLTRDLVEDQAVDILGWCTRKFSETYELLLENMIINGGGATQPEGAIVNTQFIANDVHTGAAAALTWDGIIDLLYNLNEQYDRNACVCMNKTNTARQLAKLQDGNGRPYWSVGSHDSGLTSGQIQSPLLQGYPVLFCPLMPNVGAGNYPIIFGDWSGYYLVRRVGFSIEVLRELYAETNQILLLGRVRFGGALVEDWRVRGQIVAA